MKEEALTKEQRADLVKYYLERAHECIEEAKYLKDGGYYNGSVNVYIMHALMQLVVF